MEMPNNEILDKLIAKVQPYWDKYSTNQRIIIGAGAAFIISVFIIFIVWLNKENYEVLYTNLVPEDANKVVTFLKDNNVSYKLLDGGSTVVVPDTQVYDLRVRVAGEANLIGTGIGFEIFDDVKVGQTEFVQQINYQRALQGELSRTLTELPNIESARVHLVIPQRSLFIEEQQPTSASVILRLSNPHDTMTKKEIESIVSFLAMSVEGLSKNNVSISDSAGRALYTPEEDGIGAVNTQLEYRLRLEAVLERRISELLDPILGPGKAIPKVAADLDYSQRTMRSETYDPDGQVVRSEQKSEETQRGEAGIDGGSPDPNFRGDGLTGSLSTQEGQREQSTTNYEINKVEENVIGQMGEIRRLTIAVAIDGTYARDADGIMQYVPRSEAELKQIQQLVAQTVGYNNNRGDSIEISNLAFGTNELYEQSSMEMFIEFADRMAKPLLSALLAFLIIMLVVRPIVLSMIRPRVESGAILEGLEGLPAAEEQFALFQAQEEEARQAELEDQMNNDLYAESTLYVLDENLTLDEIKAKTLQLAERNLEAAVTIIRGWMNESAATTKLAA